MSAVNQWLVSGLSFSYSGKLTTSLSPLLHISLLSFPVLLPLFLVWEWQNEHAQWIPYDPSVTHQLETSYTKITSSQRAARRKGAVPITAAGRSYTVDIVKMEQCNDSTGVIRKVRRINPAGENIHTH